MYECEKCGEKFHTPKYLTEIHNECPKLPVEIYGVSLLQLPQNRKD